jgi:hypothetical protein
MTFVRRTLVASAAALTLLAGCASGPSAPKPRRRR